MAALLTCQRPWPPLLKKDAAIPKPIDELLRTT